MAGNQKKNKQPFVTLDEVFEVLTDTSGKVNGFAVGGVQLPDSDVAQIKADAEVIGTTMLWKLLQIRTVFAAQVKGVDDAKDFGDTREAKGMIQAVLIFTDIINKLRSWKKE